MIEGLVRDAVRAVKAETGASTEGIVWLFVIPVSLAFGLLFLSWSAHVALAELYGPAIAALIIGCVYLVIAAMVIARFVVVRRRIAAEARAQLAAKGPAFPIDPAMLTIGLQIGRAIGWRRIVPLAAVGLLALGLAGGRSRGTDHPQP